ncbi:MAG: MFS transporter, partial [Erysipelotrichaceae bacterium]|nr:MFS transporter [Erysipelotrichaceae bacterium]
MRKQTRFWIVLLLFGFIGQLAWVIENMYFNVFVYNTITKDVSVIANMVALSAVTATVTTLVMGALSDKLGKRKTLMALGYLFWGFSVIIFAFLKKETVSRLFPKASAAVVGGWIAIILDCVMTFFGSTGNDAVFNAWVTDNTEQKDRGKAEGILAALPLIAMLVVFGLLDPLTQKGNWPAFFIIVGSAVSLAGLSGLLLIKDDRVPHPSESLLSSLTNGFKPSVIRKNALLYLSLVTLMTLNIAVQIFMPYMIIYIQNYLGITDYTLILGLVLSLASIISILIGGVISKVGSDLFIYPSIFLFVIGLVAMFFARVPAAVAVSGTVMMSGNLIVTSILTGLVRNFTPKDRSGQFQGIRLIFSVMIPMIIGPYIGALVISSSSETYEELGEIHQVPTPGIWLAAAVIALLVILPYRFLARKQRQLNSEHVNLKTPFAEDLNPKKPLNDYPRPQMVRGSYINLNGPWDYAIRKDGEPLGKYDGIITVPFAPETILSGVEKAVTKDDVLYYRRTFSLPENFNEGLVHLHFGAVDQIAKVYLNGNLLGEHVGGYLPFCYEISRYLQEENELTLEVRDYANTSYYSCGKQNVNRGGIWYTPTSGIWQSVWLESTPQEYIENLKITPLYDEAKIAIEVTGKPAEYEYVVKDEDGPIARVKGGRKVEIDLPDFISWTPENPYLYGLTVSCKSDEVNSYFGMRKFSIDKDDKGIPRIFLNNKPYFMKGVLDQGYFSDGYYTAPTDQALAYDIEKVREMGFNTIRKHIKIEPLRWYYHCDRLGMIVWQDMVSGGENYSFLTIAALPFINVTLKDDKYDKFGRQNEEGRRMYEQEMKETIDLLYNCVSLALWVPFNEGWG